MIDVNWKRIVPSSLAVLLLVVLGLITYAVAVEPRLMLDVRRTSAPLPAEDHGWDGAVVAVLGDQQTGMWLDNDGMVERAVREAIEAKPDVVLLAGDFIYHGDSSTVDEAVELARPLGESGIPTFAVLGNHDYSMDKEKSSPDMALAAELHEGLEAIGIEVLENESEVLTRNGDALHVVGIGSNWAGLDDPEKALASVPEGEARVVLMHNPASWRKLPVDSTPAAFAGHTHGGQLRIPLLPSTSWIHIAYEREVIADGWVAEEDMVAPGNYIYVNRGIGFSAVPARFNCAPELTLATLEGGTTKPPRPKQ